MTKFHSAMLAVVGLFMSALPALPHHSFTAEFDDRKPVELKRSEERRVGKEC